MAREIVVWCDPCMGQEMRTAGVEITVAIQTDKPKMLAMCQEHLDSLVKPLASILEEFGASIPDDTAKGRSGRQSLSDLAAGKRHGREPSSRPNQCLWCDLTYSQSGGFARHLKVAHGFTGLTEAFSGPCPVCGEGPYDLLGSHVSRAHPDLPTHTTAPFEWARDNGDPFGVYAETAARQGSLDPDDAFAEVRAVEDAVAERAKKSSAKKRAAAK